MVGAERRGDESQALQRGADDSAVSSEPCTLEGFLEEEAPGGVPRRGGPKRREGGHPRQRDEGPERTQNRRTRGARQPVLKAVKISRSSPPNNARASGTAEAGVSPHC